ncbi:MAG: hypothetical protein KatS3mg095_0832 [Candidatus Parcubacteria bacterium]|nr:MAG: hypothetical protein KatS3mg095_0832 [Candidatus Parcubacteria bacterium]
MPYKVDFTADFRATSTVKEYILIGEADGGCCGDPWLTWGRCVFSYDEERRKETPPYKKDGFEKIYLHDISFKQICRTDMTPSSSIRSNSLTVSFKRVR